ncbi:ribosomal L28e protein family-domain-containing protein [Ochromonadaceae sp. CCMP2298]|nr:ribosomal L28e protein family-domain-containing protein [Ochromonadaceae sp. CCMP2298]
MSEALVWHLIRDSNCFLVKRGRTPVVGPVRFSTEPGNLMSAHCFKYSGIANNSTVDVSMDVVLKTKDPKIVNKPTKAYTSVAMKGQSVKKTVATVAAATLASRPDLLVAAKMRAKKCTIAARYVAGLKGKKNSKKGVKKVTKRTK